VRTGEKGDEVLTLLNCSGGDVQFKVSNVFGQFKNVFTGELLTFSEAVTVNISSWGFLVFERFGKV
jgi:hypothetical protein